MDKNTIKMMIIMAVVIFGFMLINKPKPQQQTDATAQVDTTEAMEERLDSIDATEIIIAQAPDYMRQAGNKIVDDNGNATYTLADENVSLTLADGIVSGTVTVDSFPLTYNQVVTSDFPADMTLSQKIQATKNLRTLLTDAANLKQFARLRQTTPDDQAATGDDLTLQNDLIRLDFSKKGGMISRAELKNYYTYFPSKDNKNVIDTLPVVMFDSQEASYSFLLRTSEQTVPTSDLFFRSEKLNDSTLVMTLDLGEGATWALKYTLPADSYVTHVEILQNNITKVIPASTASIGFDWKMTMPRQERGRTFEERNSQIVYQYPGEKPDDINGMKTGSAQLENSTNWVAFKNQFFSNVIIANHNPFHQGGNLTQEKLTGDEYIKYMQADLALDYDAKSEAPATFDIYIGPNLYPLLNKIDDQISADGESLRLNRLVPLGWSWLRWINTLIIIPVFNFLSGFISSYGIIILLLTIFIKLLLFPLTYKSLKSQAKMRILAPEIKEINDKYPGKENAMIRQQKTMALYSKAGASPFAGCLPMLLQMPILIAMFSFFPSAIELRGESFLWAQNLAAPDIICTLPFSIPFYGDHVSLFCLLMTITNIIYTRINMQNQPTSQGMPGMKWMMYLMPIMFLFFFNDYAAALSYYYFLSLLITITLTYIFRRTVNEEKLRKKMMERAANAKTKKSGFMARLAEAQKRQQEQLRQQQQRNRRR